MQEIDFNCKNKIIVQSMTNTKTHDIPATLKQINELKNAGCEIVRVAIFDDEDANAIKELVKQSPLPIIADIHFNYLYALKAIESGVFKIRLNPGNINKPSEVLQVIEAAKQHNTWIRIGVNCGSLPENILKKYNNKVCADAMIEALSSYLKIFEENDFKKIVISLKSSDPILNQEVNEKALQKFKYPLHLGVTEAGPEMDAIIKSTIGLAPLLQKGIGNTIRISISTDPVVEVKVAHKLLNYLGLEHNRVNIISCPTCGRLNYQMFEVVNEIEEYCSNKHFPLTISILGCVVNGIGEGKHADIGLAGSSDKCMLFENGNVLKIVSSKDAVNELKKLIDIKYQNYLNK